MGYGKAWVSKLMTGKLQTLSDEQVEKLEEFLSIRKAAGVTAHDVTRHTFASHFLAWQGEASTKNAMGHTAGSSTLFRHYRRAVTEEAGKTYFGVK